MSKTLSAFRYINEYTAVLLATVFVSGFLVIGSRDLHTNILYATFVFGLIVYWRTLFNLIKIDKTIQLLLIFLSVIVLSHAWSQNPDIESFYNQIRRALFIPLFAMIFACAWGSKYQTRFIISVFLNSLCLIVLAVALYYQHEAELIFRQRLTNELSYYGTGPIRAAAPFLLCFCLSLCVLSERKNLATVTNATASLLISFPFIILSGSRGLALGIVLAIFSYFFYKKHFLSTFFIGIISIIFFMLWDITHGSAHIFERFDNARFDIWIATVERIRESLIFGEGLGMPTIIDYAGTDIGSPHNIFLTAGLNAGLIGIFFLSVLFSFLIYRCVKLQGSGFPAPAIICTASFPQLLLTVHDIVGRPDPHLWLFFVMPLAILTAYTLIEKETNNRNFSKTDSCNQAPDNRYAR